MSGFGVILGHYVRRALAYRWLVLVPAVLVFALVTLNVTVQPDIYESYAVLMPPISRPTAGSNNANREVESTMFRSATERLLSARALTQVAEKLDPYPLIRETKGMEGVVEKLRENIRVELNPNAGSITVIASHSQGDRPAELAADIVNTLTGEFIKDQREALDDNAAKAEQFLLQQKARQRLELERARSAVEEFKAKHPGELPDDVETNKLEIERATQSITDNRQNQRLFQAESRRLQGELALREAEMNRLKENGDAAGAAAVTASERLLDSLKAEMATLLVSYTEDHPTVLKRKAYMTAVEAQTEQLRQQAHGGSAMDQIALLNFTMEEIQKQYERSVKDAASIDEVITNLHRRIKDAEERNLKASSLEVQYASLNRDIKDLEERYASVETRLAEAQYHRKYGEYDSTTPILIEQSGFVSAVPARPDRLLTSFVGIIVGFGIGIGLAIARYKLNATYEQAEDLRALMPGAVLVTIPEVRTSGVRVGRAIAGVLGGLLLAGIFAGTVAILGIQLGWWGDPSMIRALINLR
ncbi:MAG TPA: hypothetical protein VFY93_05055 [Planctomycetota bacterium]|nr:hypothetical protein [Planctomycetota bacterium]